MPAKPLFTIVVSGYQNEPYLPKCLESIASQTFGDFEAICYVEESTDNSLAICQEWAKRDARFAVASGPKSGSGSATRNYGIDHAQGEYLVVVDGDDWIAKDMLGMLAARLNQTGTLDILAFAATFLDVPRLDSSALEKAKFSNFAAVDALSELVFSGQEAIRRIAMHNPVKLYAYTWLNIYRLSFVRKNHFRQLPGMAFEDFEWFPKIFFAAQKVAYINDILYFYRRNPNSIVHQPSTKKFFDLAHHFQSLTTFLSNHSIPADIQAIWSNQWLWTFFNLIYHWSLSPSDIERKAILKIFFATKPKTFFWRFLLRSAWHRVLALPLLWLDSHDCQMPAKFYFRKIYPKLDWRFRLHQFPFHLL